MFVNRSSFIVLAMAASASQAQPPSTAGGPSDRAALDVSCYGALALEQATLRDGKGEPSRADRERAIHYLAASQFFGGRLTARYPMTDLVSVLRSTPPMAAGQKRRDMAFTCVQYFQVTMLALADSLRASLDAAPAPPK